MAASLSSFRKTPSNPHPISHILRSNNTNCIHVSSFLKDCISKFQNHLRPAAASLFSNQEYFFQCSALLLKYLFICHIADRIFKHRIHSNPSIRFTDFLVLVAVSKMSFIASSRFRPFLYIFCSMSCPKVLFGSFISSSFLVF